MDVDRLTAVPGEVLTEAQRLVAPRPVTRLPLETAATVPIVEGPAEDARPRHLYLEAGSGRLVRATDNPDPEYHYHLVGYDPTQAPPGDLVRELFQRGELPLLVPHGVLAHPSVAALEVLRVQQYEDPAWLLVFDVDVAPPKTDAATPTDGPPVAGPVAAPESAVLMPAVSMPHGTIDTSPSLPQRHGSLAALVTSRAGERPVKSSGSLLPEIDSARGTTLYPLRPPVGSAELAAILHRGASRTEPSHA